MLRIHWLLCVTLVTLVVFSLLQAASAKTSGHGSNKKGLNVLPEGKKVSTSTEMKGADTNTLISFPSSFEGFQNSSRPKPAAPKGRARAAGVIGRRKSKNRRVMADSRRIRRPSQRKRRANWRKRKNKKGKKSKTNKTENTLFSQIIDTIKNETKDLVEELKDEIKESIKNKAKETTVGLLNSISTNVLAKTFCDCRKIDCECCADWGVLGEGCLKVEVFNEDNPSIDIIVKVKCGPELASITLSKKSKFGENNDACFNMIPFVTDACIVPVSFKPGPEMVGSFNVTVDAFSLRSNYRIIYDGARTRIEGTPFSLFSKP